MKTAHSVEVVPNGEGGRDLLINGEVFPFHIHADGPTVTEVGPFLYTRAYIVNIPLLVLLDK